MHVVIVDDSAAARRALAGMLEREGLTITPAAAAGAARRIAHAQPPGAVDVILMDLHLPDGTGIEACAHIKRLPGCTAPTASRLSIANGASAT
jgi:CheY-like chemotaxis protein